MRKLLNLGVLITCIFLLMHALAGAAWSAATVSLTPSLVAPGNQSITFIGQRSDTSTDEINITINISGGGSGAMKINAYQSTAVTSVTLNAVMGNSYAATATIIQGTNVQTNVTIQGSPINVSATGPIQPTTAPKIVAVNGQAVTGTIYVNSKTIIVTGTGDANTTLEVSLTGPNSLVDPETVSTGGQWISKLTATTDGQYTVVATNSKGASNSVTFTVDRVAPTFSVTYPSTPPFGVTGTQPLKVTITATEDLDPGLNVPRLVLPDGHEVNPAPVPFPTGSTRTYTVDLTIASTNGATTINGQATTDGTCRWFLSGYDKAQNLGTVLTAGETFIVSTSGPSASGASVTVENGAQYTQNRSLSFKWQGFTHSMGLDRIQRFWYIASPGGTVPPGASATDLATVTGWSNIPNGSPASGSGSGTVSAASDGTWEVYVKAQDANNNYSGAVKATVIVDATGPSVDTASVQPAPGSSSATEQTELVCDITDPLSGVNRDSITLNVLGVDYAAAGTSSPNASPAMKLGLVPGQNGRYRLVFTPQLIGLKYPRSSMTVMVSGRDMAGNPIGGTAGSTGTPYSWTFTVNVNSNAPSPNQPSPTAGNYYNNKRPPISLHLDDADGIDASSVTMTVANGTSFMTFNVGPNLTLTNPGAGGTDSVLALTPPTDFADGTVTVTLQNCKDKLGNAVTPYPWTFYVDTTAPVASEPQPSANVAINSTNPIISFKLDDAGAGVDTDTDSVQVRVRFTSSTGAIANFEKVFNAFDSPGNPGMTYNSSTKILAINTSLASPALTFGIGSVEVSMTSARDRARALNGTLLPNVTTTPFTWTFSISNSAGPYVVFGECSPLPPDQVTHAARVTNLEPMVMRITLSTDNLINHSSLLLDFNGRTFRDGDSQISWQTNTTNEVVILNLRNDTSLLTQGTNTVSLRTASDRSGRALQNAPVDLSIVYDTVGPVASSPSPADGSTIYDVNNVSIQCGLTDATSGIDRVTMSVQDNGSLVGIFGTDSTPVNLVYDSANKLVVYRPSSALTSGHAYTFSLIASVGGGTIDGTRDRAGNGIGKVAGSNTTADFTWHVNVAQTNEVITLVKPVHDTFVNVKKSDFMFQWNALPNSPTYRLTVSGNLSFTNAYSYDTTAVTFTDGTLQNELLKHGNIYYWRVSAVPTGGGPVYASSEIRQFTVDNLPPQTPKIVGINDYVGLNPQHINWTPLTKTSHVKQRNFRVKVLLYEGAASTVGYTISVGYVKNVDGTSLRYTELGTNSNIHGLDTNEVDITLPNDDGEYRLVAYVVDRANNFSTPSEEARVYLNRKAPKVNSVILTSPSPNASGYITSGKIKFEVQFNTPIDMAPLTDYSVRPSVKFDPRSADGTSAIELSDLTVTGKSVTGYGYIPFGEGTQFDGMADIIITGFMDMSWIVMEGGSMTYYKYFEIDTAPGFGITTFLNPVDEKNVLINIQASETLLLPPSCYITVSNGNVNQLPVNIMAKNLYAASTTGTVGENNIRVSGLDTRNNIGYWPTPDVLKESKFLMIAYDRDKGANIASKSMGVSVEIPRRAIADSANLYVMPYKLSYIGNDYLSKASKNSSAARSAKNAAARMASALENNIVKTVKIKSNDNKVMMVTSDGNNASAEIVKETVAVPSGSAQTVEESEITQLSNLYNITPSRNLRVNGKVYIDMPADQMKGSSGRNIGVYYSPDGILWDYVGGAYDGSRFNATMKNTGIYGVFADKKAPVFAKPQTEGNLKVSSSRPEISAYVSDFGSGIDPENVIVKIDGKSYPADFNETDAKVSFIPQFDLKSGNHNIVFEVTDRAGNVSRQANNVVVPNVDPRITNAVPYPNPVKRGSNVTINFNVDGTLGSAVEAKVYIYDTNAELVTELTPVQNGNNFRALWMGLLNDDGNSVANGVYLYKIKVNCADKKVEKYGKVAVLK